MSSIFSQSGYNTTTWSVGDLSGWDTSSVIDMESMFNKAGYNATSWSIGDISGWDTSNVTNMFSMFRDAGYKAIYRLDLSGWNVNKVTYRPMFHSGVETKVIPPIWVN